MSRAKAKAERVEHDYYPTPRWCVERILDNCPILRKGGYWLEPCAGEGHLVNAVNDWWLARRALLYKDLPEVEWHVNELRQECDAVLTKCFGVRLQSGGDYLERATRPCYDVGFTNPPFTLWQQFHYKMMQECKIVALLLRLDVLGSAGRREFWQSDRGNCDIYVLSDRPSFTNDGGTDSGYYAWFIWHKNADRRWRVI